MIQIYLDAKGFLQSMASKEPFSKLDLQNNYKNTYGVSNAAQKF